MSFNARPLLFAAVALLSLASVTAQAKPSHSKGRWPVKGSGCSFSSMDLAVAFTPVSADRIYPATPDIKNASIATNIVRSFNLHAAGDPNGPTIGGATTSAILMDMAGSDIRVANAFIHIKFAGGPYDGWLTATGNLIYDFTGAAPAVRGDASISSGTEDFLGAVGTLVSEIISGVGTLTLKLQVPVKQCFAAPSGKPIDNKFPK